jgi:hypothetical protein
LKKRIARCCPFAAHPLWWAIGLFNFHFRNILPRLYSQSTRILTFLQRVFQTATDTRAPLKNSSASETQPLMVYCGKVCVLHFTIRWMTKDLTYALRAADELGVPVPLVAAAREAYKMALQLGLGDLDIAAIGEVLRERGSD